MKLKIRNLFVLAFGAFFASFLSISCGSLKTTAHGLENISYLQIVGDSGTYEKVTVVLDDTISFDALVNDNTQRTVKNEYSYKITVGAHDIEIRSGETILTRKKIFASANEVKIVEVP